MSFIGMDKHKVVHYYKTEREGFMVLELLKQ